MKYLQRIVAMPRALLIWGVWIALLYLPASAFAQSKAAEPKPAEVTLQMQFWVDEGGQATVNQLSKATPDPFVPMDKHRSFSLQKQAALWMRLDLPAMDTKERWYLQLSSGSFIDRASLFQLSNTGEWVEQFAGDHLPVADWTLPNETPVFQLNTTTANTVWIRLQNYPASLAPRLQLVGESTLTAQRHWTYLLLGGYFGFGLLVLFLGIVHARLYADRAFIAYSAYVAFMLCFQLAFTGIGGLFLWPNAAAWNNASPAFFMLLLTASGIWFVREACVLVRHSRWVDKAAMVWVGFGVIFTLIYPLLANRSTFVVLNLYGLLSVVLSIALCLWVWRRGERYGGWLFLGFLPVHLGYPFPALRSAGIIADNWLSQYAVLIGSAVEIPLLLYVLHLRAKEFSENRARMRAIDHTDPLTGLAIAPVLTLRVRDALRRNRRKAPAHTLILVELANHADIVEADGRPIGDRALVVAASSLLSTVSELDTVCRVDDTRFAILVEPPLNSISNRLLAQQIIARGLSQLAAEHSQKSLRFRVVTASLDHVYGEATTDAEIDLDRVLAPLIAAMDQLAEEPRKTIFHLPPTPVTDPAASASVAYPPAQP